MKKSIYFFVCFFVFNLASAQQEINTAYATQATNMFAPLDKNRIPHKVLLDFGFEYTDVKAFNGTLTDSTVVDVPTLKHIYNTLFSSRVTNATTGFISPNNFDSNWKTNRIAGTVTVSGLYYKYNAFINDAINLGKVNYVNNQFQDKFVNGVWQNPYQEFQAFAMAPAITKYEGLSFNVKIPSTIFYSNYQSLVQSIQIDFGNGAGYVPVPFNQNVTVNYTTEGVKTWRFKLNLTNGTSLVSQSKIEVTKGITTIPWGSFTPSTTAMVASSMASSTIYSHNITATKDYNGTFGKVKLTIDDTNNDGIRRPLIVAEGFDAGIILAPELTNGMNSYYQFRNSTYDGGTELRSLIYNSNKQYDIIYVDWNNGVDFLQKNAFALEAVIAWVNSVKIGTEKNVVLGQSMGGVIARYALADMEQSSLDHKTRLFVSHDAPQQGANIPVSVQYMFRHVTNLYNRYASPYGTQVIDVPFLEDSILDQPATKQMLINWVNGFSNIDNTVSSNFYTELRGNGLANSGGYPVNCRNIALSNGAECGITQGFNTGDDLLSYNLSGKLPFLQNLLVPLAGFLGYTAYQDPNILAIGFVGLLPGSSRYNVEFNAKSIPYGTGNQIYKGRISYTKKLFKIFGWAPTITVNITNIQKTQPTGVLPIDHYAGGRYDTTLFTAGATLPSGIYIRDRFNFIPTPSALDIGKGNVSLNDNDYKTTYVGATPPVAPKNSPFSNFSTDFEKSNPSASNKTHISFNSRNGEWLASELNINAITTNCSAFCSNAQITGSTLLCTSGIYSVTNEATSSSWSISEGSSLVTMSVYGNQVTINQINPSSSGYITLNANYSNSRCGIASVSKRIWVGRPKVQDQNIYGGYDNVPKNTQSTFSVTPVPGATQYYWFIYNASTTCGCTTDSSGLTICPTGTVLPKFSSNNGTTYTSTSTTASVNWGNCTGTYVVNCIAKNACGEDGISHKIVDVFSTTGGGGGGSNPCEGELLVYPNPINKNGGSGDVSVNIVYPGDPCNDDVNFLRRSTANQNQITIYDFYGNKIYANQYTTDEFSIKGIDLKRGHYILNVFTSKGFSKKEILIVE